MNLLPSSAASTCPVLQPSIAPPMPVSTVAPRGDDQVETEVLLHLGCTIEEAQRAMMSVDPHLATRLPSEALATLKQQFSAYMAGDSPFNRVRQVYQSQREWWEPLLKDQDSDVLVVCFLGIVNSSPLRLGIGSRIQVESVFLSFPPPVIVTINKRRFKFTQVVKDILSSMHPLPVLMN